MKKFLCGSLALFILTACDNTTNSEPKVPTKDDMVRYYDKMSDNEIRQVFKSQNIGRCVAEFQSQHVPNTQNACDCIMDKTIRFTSNVITCRIRFINRYAQNHSTLCVQYTTSYYGMCQTIENKKDQQTLVFYLSF
ncbi:MAG: hypothetical protein Q3971_05080 [Moraxella sp.]|nr:hypothetical protein [Moraxella sp.]